MAGIASWALLGSIAMALSVGVARATPGTPPSAWPGAELFTNGPVPELHLEIAPADLDRLRNDAREFVRATLTDGHSTFGQVAARLKGSIGSFRTVDDKPAWTLDFSRFNPGQRFHGLRRIHLNNSVEDPSYCNEWLGGELFRQAGIPAPRVTHALVFLNGHRLGLYVLKEGFTEDFLSCYFNPIADNLFEPGEGHDVNQRLKRVSLAAPQSSRAPLEALAEAALEENPAQRWERLGKVLDRDRFLTFMALEVMLCHRDGYCLARNNYRVYEDLDSGKVLFFPHGMDQLLGRPGLPWKPHPAGLVARAVIESPQGAEQYRTRFASLFANLFNPPLLSSNLDRLVAHLRPALTAGEFDALVRESALVKQRIVARQENLRHQLLDPEPKPLDLVNNAGQIESWLAADPPSTGGLDKAKSPDGIPSLHIITHSETAAAWKAKAVLPRGHYRFEGRARVSGVQPLSAGVHQGAGLRLAGQARQSEDLVGNTSWQTLAAEFEVTAESSEVEFVCELRARAGEAWFDRSSLRVVRMP